jgi:hypothetical protein
MPGLDAKWAFYSRSQRESAAKALLYVPITRDLSRRSRGSPDYGDHGDSFTPRVVILSEAPR